MGWSCKLQPAVIDFLSDSLAVKVANRPIAPGVYRQDLTDAVIKGKGLKWGISMILSGVRLITVGFNRLAILALIEARVPDFSRS